MKNFPSNIILGTINFLEPIAKKNKSIDLNLISNRLTEIENFLENNIYDVEELLNNIIRTFDGLRELVECNTQKEFLNLIINDTEPRIELALEHYFKLSLDFEGRDKDNFNFQNDFKELREEVKKVAPLSPPKKKHETRMFKALDKLIKSKIISNRSRWLILTVLKSTNNSLNASHTKELIKKAEQLCSNKVFGKYTDIFDPGEQPITLLLSKKQYALFSISTLFCYSHACYNQLPYSHDLKEKNFPVLNKNLIKQTRDYLLKDFKFDISERKIKDLIRNVTDPYYKGAQHYFQSSKLSP